MSKFPPRFDENASFEPSGDQEGPLSCAGALVSWARPVPEGLTVNRSKLPSRSLENAIVAPVGDHAGVRSLAELDVSRRSPLPSAFTV